MAQIIIVKPEWIKEPNVETVVESRTMGEDRLSMLSMHSGRESVWVYINDCNVWNDISYYPKSSGQNRVHAQPFKFYLSNVKAATLYNVNIRRNELELYSGFENADEEFTPETMRHFSGVEVSVPRPEEMDSYENLLRRYDDVNLDFRIVSPHGIVTIEHHKYSNPRTAAKLYREAWKGKSLLEITGMSAECKNPVSESIKNIVEFFNRKLSGYATMYHKENFGIFAECSDRIEINKIGNSSKN